MNILLIEIYKIFFEENPDFMQNIYGTTRYFK